PIQKELNSAGVWISFEHFVSLERVNANAVLDSWSEFARGQNVGISPEPVLGIIWKVEDSIRRGLERVAVVCASRITARRNRDTVPERLGRIVKAAGRELRKQPAIFELVVQHDWIACRIRAIRDGEVRPEGTGIDRARFQA